MRAATRARCRSKLAATLAARNGSHARPRRALGRRVFNRDIIHAPAVAMWINLSAPTLTERVPSGWSIHLRIVRGHLPTSLFNGDEIEVCENLAHGCGLSQHQKMLAQSVVAATNLKKHNRANRPVARGCAGHPQQRKRQAPHAPPLTLQRGADPIPRRLSRRSPGVLNSARTWTVTRCRGASVAVS